ncbi:2620_t:CDS:1, partial [Gigaspora margarita]
PLIPDLNSLLVMPSKKVCYSVYLVSTKNIEQPWGVSIEEKKLKYEV